MFKVYFKPEHGHVRLLGQRDSYLEAEHIIGEFLNEHNYKAPYYRFSKTEYRGYPATMYDVGSHTEFFYITEVNKK